MFETVLSKIYNQTFLSYSSEKKNIDLQKQLEILKFPKEVKMLKILGLLPQIHERREGCVFSVKKSAPNVLLFT